MSEFDQLSTAEIYTRIEDAAAGRQAYLLRLLQRRPDGEAYLVRLIGHPDAQMRLLTINLLAAQTGAGVVSALIEALADEDARVSRAAARRLAAIKAPTAVAPLIAQTQDSRAAVRDESIRALGKLGDVRAARRLLELLGSSEQATRLSAVIALYNIGDPVVVDGLIEALADPAAQIRAWAVKGLAKIADENTTAVIERALRGMRGDPDKYVSQLAQTALADLEKGAWETEIDDIPRTRWLYRTWLQNPTLHAGSEMYTFHADGRGVVEDFYMGLTRDLALFEYIVENDTLAFRFENRDRWIRTRFSIIRDTFAHPYDGDVPCLKLIFESEPYFRQFGSNVNSEYFYLP